MSLVISIIALCLAVFSLGVNADGILSRIFGRKNSVKLPDEEIQRLQREADKKEREINAFNSYTGYEK